MYNSLVRNKLEQMSKVIYAHLYNPSSGEVFLSQPTQLPLFPDAITIEQDPTLPKQISLKELGTFKDSMRAPIHSWFRYPAGYSYKLVNQVFAENHIGVGNFVYDPFSGTGTTLICAKSRGINGYGVEAHSFVHWVAEVKLHWEFDYNVLWQIIETILKHAKDYVIKRKDEVDITGEFPELIYKCYHPLTLKELFLLREFILHDDTDANIQNLLKLALTDTLRNAAAAGTGWPYISPRKNTGDKPPKDALKIFSDTVRKMCQHLYSVGRDTSKSITSNVLGDSRLKQSVPDNTIDLALTSPPYLNNYDYADRTRLETYFWGIAQTWGEITQLYRNKLIVAATTQIVRGQYNVESTLTEELRAIAPNTYNAIQRVVQSLTETRLTKGGKKDYDLMVALYFNDMLQVIKETYRILKPGKSFYLILGDSAPYGIHVHTEQYISEISLALGFSESDYIEFRKRGGKWKQNPQRHNVPLREGALILTK